MRAFFFLLFLFFSFPVASAVAGDCLDVGCHAQLADAPGAHAPVAAGDCRACHLSHESASPSLLAAPLPDLCIGCHPAIESALRLANVRHAPLYRKRSCLECHRAHASAQPRLLAKAQRELCLSCHGRDDFRKSETLRNVGRELQGQPQLHGPLAAGECVACHLPHGSDYFRLFNAAYPEKTYIEYEPERYAFCFGCHRADLLEAETETTGFRHGERNLHRLHVVEPRKGRTCRTCHAPHAGGERLLIAAGGTDFGRWQIPLRAELTATGGRCFSGCHLPQAYDRTASGPAP